MTSDLAFAGLDEHLRLLAAGQTTSEELTALFLDRIERYDPAVNAYRAVFGERARAEAAQADARRRAGDDRPLLGVPIAIKDDAALAGEVTTWGTSANETPADADAEVVRRLRAAGAVILGKTNVPELMITPFTESPTFGITRNPWDRQRGAGGSSGGVAAGPPAAAASAAAGAPRGGAGSRGAGLRRRRLDPDPRRGVRAVRPQAGARPRADGADVRALARAVHVGPDHAARGRQRPNLRRHPRRRGVVRGGRRACARAP